MVSDGIADAGNDEWLQNLLAGWSGRDVNALVSLILAVGIFSLCFLLANEYFKQRMQEKEGQKLELAADSISIDTEWKDNGFLVGIQSGRVIVYEADTQQVYEYTDIDAAVLQKLHPSVYQDLLKNVHFDSKKELYRYLESLST